MLIRPLSQGDAQVLVGLPFPRLPVQKPMRRHATVNAAGPLAVEMADPAKQFDARPGTKKDKPCKQQIPRTLK